jgi:hypothetical protein
VYGATQGGNNSHVDYYGKTSTAEGCSDACNKTLSCIAFTWHDGNQPAGSQSWEDQCYFVNTGNPIEGHAQTHHVSGVKTVVIPQNVWVARGVEGAPQAVTGLRIGGNRGIRARWPVTLLSHSLSCVWFPSLLCGLASDPSAD